MTGRHELSQPLRDLAGGVPISDPTNLLLVGAADELDALTSQVADLVFELGRARGMSKPFATRGGTSG